jgi:hypothetical protein
MEGQGARPTTGRARSVAEYSTLVWLPPAGRRATVQPWSTGSPPLLAVTERPGDPGFTVVDRRGHGRSQEPEPPTPAPAGPDRAAEAPPPRRPVSEPDRVAADVPQGPGRADLTALCAMLYSEALIHLGQVPDPATGEPATDPDQARFSIDLLAMLEEKTQGNRTAEESALLEEALAALRLAYVHLTRGR